MKYIVRTDQDGRSVAYKILKHTDNLEKAQNEVMAIMLNWFTLFPHSVWEIREIAVLDYEPMYSVDCFAE